MTTQSLNPGITFVVDDVVPATDRLETCKLHEALRWPIYMGARAESCSDYHGDLVDTAPGHGLLMSVHLAFATHRPLVLTPDVVWITILQGVAHHMALNAERLRGDLVSHQGRETLRFTFDDWVAGSPENPWRDAFETWSEQIREHVGSELHDALVCDFSTTTPDDRAVSQIVMMDIFERYFHYEAGCICGIPTITLEGTPADWQHLLDKVDALERFDIDWWLVPLRAIGRQFVRASQGDIDRTHWQRICKLREEYGGAIVNGWIAQMFPYLPTFPGGPSNRKNPIFETGEGFSTLYAPSALSKVPVTWKNASGTTRTMEAVGGLVGSRQDPDTGAIRARSCWAVRQAPPMDVLLARLFREHRVAPVTTLPESLRLPADLSQFYHRTNGAELFKDGEQPAQLVILPIDELEEFGHSRWYRFARLPDGSCLVINVMPRGLIDPRVPPEAPWTPDWECERFCPVCLASDATRHRMGENAVIAYSFTDLLERLFASEGMHYWLQPNFKPIGNAEQFVQSST